MTRPRVICHMMASIDGRIVTDGWPISSAVRQQYEIVHRSYAPDAWLCGRVTMEHFSAGVRADDDLAREHDGAAREDFIALGDHRSYAIAIDARGRLCWNSGDIDGDHVVAVMTERVSDDCLSALRERGVSYLLAGADTIDLSVALDKIGTRLAVRTLMLEGGGGINGSMLRAGLVDEVSVLIAPVIDGRIGTATLFDVAGDGIAPRQLTLMGSERREGGLLWTRYSVNAPAA